MLKNVLVPTALIAAIAWPAACQQTPAALPSFEVASVRPSAPNATGGEAGHFRTGKIAYENTRLKSLIEEAFNVKDYQIAGPDWLSSLRFDITATMPIGTPQAPVRLMLQRLLMERFKLAIHRETKELPKYVLVTAKNGPKMKAAAPGGADIRSGHGRVEAQNITMSDLAAKLSSLLSRPVSDETGLTGGFNFTLDFTPETPQPMPFDGGAEKSVENTGNGPSIFTALQEQLGLKLESRRGPLAFLVIDHVERVPTEN